MEMSNITNLIDQLKQEIANECSTKIKQYEVQIRNMQNEKTELVRKLRKNNQMYICQSYSAEVLANEKRMLSEKIKELESTIETLKTDVEQKDRCSLIVSEDPRVKNRSLPNDATLDYSFGARAYTTTVYPGFVWRNGNWYKIRPGLKFRPMSDKRIQKMAVVDICDESKHNEIKHINDSYVPVFINDVRYFIRFVYKRSQTNDNAVYISKTYYYVPSTQNIVINADLVGNYVYEDNLAFIPNPKSVNELDSWAEY